MTARTRTRLFIASWLSLLSLAWVELAPTPVQATTASPPAATIELPTQGPLAKAPGKTPADAVVVVSIDGLRPDVISPSTKSLHRLYLQGASARVARTINKSATLPSHASMISGVDSTEHGLDFNAYRPEHANINRATIFSVAHAAGFPTFMFVGKAKLKHLLSKPSDAQLKVAGIHCKRVVKEAMPQLQKIKRGLIFLHFANPDSAGHRHGWMTDEYMEAVQAADECLGDVMATIEESGRMSRTLLVVTADHGGHGRSHGTRMEVDQRIPWFAWGGSARRGRTERPVHTFDTAATVITALGLAVPSQMHGHAVGEALGTASGPSGMPIVGLPVGVP